MLTRIHVATGVLLAAVLLIAGCGGEEKKAPGMHVNETKSVLMKDLSPQDVIVRINGVEITKRDFLVRRSLNEKVYRLRNRIALGVKNKKARNYIRTMEKSIPDEYIRHELFRQAADAEGVVVPEKRMRAEFKRFLNYIGRPKESKEKVLSLLGKDEGRVLMDFLRDGVRAEILRDRMATNGYYTVSDETVSNHLERISKWNANAKRLNEKAQKKAMQFRAKAVAGEDFAALGKTTAQIRPEYAERWDSIQLLELTDDEAQLREWLKTANKGDISGPIDFDDGIAIVKVLDKWKEPQGPGSEPVDEFELARCTFKAYQYAIAETTDEIRARHVRDRKKDLMRQLGDRLWKAAVIEFPNGCDFFEGKKEQTVAGNSPSSHSNDKHIAPSGGTIKEEAK